MKILVHGCTGRMGRTVTQLIEDAPEYTQVAGVDITCQTDPEQGLYRTLEDFQGQADVIIDFSHHSAAPALCAYATQRHIPLVIATTGQSPEERDVIYKAGESIPVFFSGNMSLGIAVLCDLARQAAAAFPGADIEIVEAHHNMKLDVPSGTALMLFHSIQKARPNATALVGRHEYGLRQPDDIGIHSLRYGSEVGTHEVIISTGTQTLKLRHEAESRMLFAEGALSACAFICQQPPGVYQMEDLVRARREQES